jgi:ribosomal-protein-alanine N-acetyltransferase
MRPEMIQTERLVLVALLPEDVAALVAGDPARASLLTGCTFPDGWPDDAAAREGLPWHLRALRGDAAQVHWRIRVIVERSSGTVIGSINLKGPPDADGDVEIGWGLIEPARRQGFALEAASAVAAWVAMQPGAVSLSATVPEDNQPSQRLAAKLGMVRTGAARRDLPLWVRHLASRELR